MTDEKIPATNSRGKVIVYWITTVLVALAMGTGGVSELLRLPALVAGMSKLGYPVYVCTILGVWKVLGTIAILIPRTPRLKEWAYAGIVFDLTGAAASHFFASDASTELVAPIVLTLITFASWALRPASRYLPGPSL